MDEENRLKTEVSSDNGQEMNSVFTKKVEPVGRVKYAFMSLGQGALNLLLWVANFVLSIFVSLGLAIWTAIKGIYKGILAIGRFFKRKAHQFRYNDIWGRLSFLFWGAGSVGHGQIVNGILYFLFEVGYIACFVLFGAGNIAFLFNNTIGTQEFGYDPACKEKWGEAYQTYCNAQEGHNSIMILIFALLWIVSIFIFFYIWNRNINAGYNNYRIKHFSFYKEVDQKNIPFSDHLSDEAKAAFEKGVKKGAFKKQMEPEIAAYLKEVGGEDKLAKSYSTYLIRESINHAYDYLNKLKKQNAKLAKLEEKKAKDVQKMEAKIQAATNPNPSEKDLVNMEKLTNKLTSITAKHDSKIKKQKHVIDELNKRYSSFADMQHTKNNDRYGKYNIYFKTVANIDNDLNLYSHYFEYMDLYKATLGKNVDYNQANVQKGVELKETSERKIAETKEKFNMVRAKREDLKKQIQDAKDEYSLKLKAIRNDQTITDKEKAMADAKLELVEKCTRLNNSLNDLPGENTIKAMEKEEIKEYRHSYLRDKKALKTNFTSESYARQVVLDCMLVEHRIEYHRANRFADLMFGSNGAHVNKMSEADVNKKVADLQEERNKYVEAHPDRFVGKPKTFIEQVTGLFDENFHITILFLPILGIVMMTILPLIFSIVIAFTNYGEGHLPPNDLFGWIGFANFQELFASDATSQLGASLVKTVGWTFLWAFAATFSNYILGIIVALMINKDGIKFKKFWRTIFVLTIAVPQFIYLVCISIMLKDNAAIDTLWQWAFGANLNFAQKDYINATKLIIILVNIWVGIPYTILSTTGILMNIPKDLYESSEVDGASKFTQFFKITMPYILFVTGPYLITQFVGNINNFNVIFFLSTNVKPIAGSVGDIYGLKPTDLLITFLYSLVTNNSHPKFGMASAIGIIIFIICAFFSLIMYGKSGSIQEEDQFQ